MAISDVYPDRLAAWSQPVKVSKRTSRDSPAQGPLLGPPIIPPAHQSFASRPRNTLRAMRATTMASAIALALCVGAHAHVIVTAKGGVGAQSCAWRTRIATLGSLRCHIAPRSALCGADQRLTHARPPAILCAFRNCVMHEAPASPPVSSPFAAGGKVRGETIPRRHPCIAPDAAMTPSRTRPHSRPRSSRAHCRSRWTTSRWCAAPLTPRRDSALNLAQHLRPLPRGPCP